MTHSEDSSKDSSSESANEIFKPATASDSTPAQADGASEAAEPTKINLPATIAIDHTDRIEAEPAEAAWTDATELPPQRSWMRQRAPLAAGVTLAVALGAIAGAAGTTMFVRKAPHPAPTATAHTNQALQQSLARLEGELASVKAGIASAQRSAGTQFGKLAERIDRAEKAQVEPAQKLAKIIESLDRVEHRMPQSGVLPPAADRADVTGSVAVAKIEPKQEAKPPLAEGWHLLDVYAGRAMVESRSGRVFEVGPGSNLPELGRVEGIRREDGRMVVVTRNGIIAASTERRRMPRFMPRFPYGD